MAERKECPYCGKSFTKGFHGYCGKQCALADKGNKWVEKAEKSDRRWGRFPVIFWGSIIVIALGVTLFEKFLK